MAALVERLDEPLPDLDDPNLIVNEDGSVEIPIEIQEVAEVENEALNQFDVNLADYLEDGQLSKLAGDVVDGFEADKSSRAEHEEAINKGLDLLGLKFEEKTDPFKGACNATHPLILETAVKFEAKAIQELYPSVGPVKSQIFGVKTPEVLDKAARIKDFMNYQLLKGIPDYYRHDERLLIQLPIIGKAFKKLYYKDDHPCVEYIPFDQFHISYWASSLQSADRYTHVLYLSEKDLQDRTYDGTYRELELGAPTKAEIGNIQQKVDQITGMSQPDSQHDSRYTLLEQHLYLRLDEDPQNVDGRALPYVVTVDLTTKQVLSIRRNWDPNDTFKKKLLWFSDYDYVPGFGFYGLGLIHLIGNFVNSATFAMRSLVDAGQFANLPAGFKSRNFRVTGDNAPLQPGEWREVEYMGEDMRAGVFPLPYKSPDPQLMAMLQYLDGRGQRFADSTEQVVADATNYGPVGTTLALLDASTKFYASIFKRVHAARCREFDILYRINSQYLPPVYPYEPVSGGREIKAQDFDGSVSIVPVSDPNLPSMQHRMAKATAQLDLALKTPQIHDMREAVRRVYEAMEVPDIDRLIPPPPASYTGDPVSENMMASAGKPLQVAPYQDHEAHLAVHKAFAEDPNFGGSALLESAKSQLQAHMREHLAHAYKRLVDMAMGQPTPQPGQPLPPQMEIPLSQAEAQVGEKIRSFGAAESPEAIMAKVELMNAETAKRRVEHMEEYDTAKLALSLRQQDVEEAKVLLEAIEKGESARAKLSEIKFKADTEMAREAVRAALNEKGPNDLKK